MAPKTLTAKTIVVTGASDGIGAAAARQLHRAGHTVVIVGRSAHKTQHLATELGVSGFTTDFTDLAQVRKLAHDLQSQYRRIDVLVNNAGGMRSKTQLTPDGFEETYQVNYLAPFLLTTSLLDHLVSSRASIVNTTSSAQKFLGSIGIEKLRHTDRTGPGVAYALTKLAIILFTKELHRRYHEAGVSAVAFHPGYVNTNLAVASGWRSLAFFKSLPTMRLAPTAERGADHLVGFAAGMPAVDWQSGEYYSRQRRSTPHRAAADQVLSRQLWDLSLQDVAI